MLVRLSVRGALASALWLAGLGVLRGRDGGDSVGQSVLSSVLQPPQLVQPPTPVPSLGAVDQSKRTVAETKSYATPAPSMTRCAGCR